MTLPAAEPRCRRRADLCLVVPPFDSIRFPPLGSAVLASACRARGIGVRVVYGSVLLASRIGDGTYRSVCTFSHKEMLGDRLFVPHAYPAQTLERLGGGKPMSETLRPLYDKVAPQLASFLRQFVRQILATRPRIVGISSTFQQNLAAGAVARLVKERAPDVCVVLGGANVARPMGEGLAEVFPWVDYFFSGEADVAFPDFCEGLLRGERPAARLIDCKPIADMSVVHAPDFTDFFASLRHYQRRGRLPAHLPEFLAMESSRGCWWGEKHHCTFCGLNGEGMGFRKKPAARVLEEVSDLTRTWGISRIHAADNIMPQSFFTEVLPKLAEWPRRPSLFYEVKANLREDQIDLMSRAGIDSIQPGIESLSSNVLRLMRKGVSAMQNIALLRACRVRGMHVLWNLLYGFPGEQVEDYETAAALMPKLEHLPPPHGISQIVIDRYSPYHRNAQELGIGPITPQPSYAALYPADAPLSEIAYHFQGAYSTPLLSNEAVLQAFRAGAQAWKRAWEGGKPMLRTVALGPGKWLINDTRGIARKGLASISPEALAALAYFERPRSLSGHHGMHAEQIDELLAADYLIRHEGLLMSVVARAGEHLPADLPVGAHGAAPPPAPAMPAVALQPAIS